MRLHHLSIQAFGPFPQRVEVDFDTLSEAGLFLLSGATGAGKTSVLDAVCFALYGDVPGDRSSAKRLRCDTAAEGVAPEVCLELSLSGRRFRLLRSPQWMRPKRRGAGFTTEQARVVCEERRDGTWQALSTRLDETGHLITRLLGMNLAQFCQVAMLPQGQFQGFLRARSEERHTLLQRLFETDRFERVEQVVRERARDLGRRSAEHAAALDRLISRIAEAAGVSTPPEWEGADRAMLIASGAIAQWSEGTVASARSNDRQLADALRRARVARAELHRRAAAAHHTSRLRLRGEQASAELTAAEAAADEQHLRRAQLEAAQRAEPVLPLQRMVTAAMADVTRALGARDATWTTAQQAISSFRGTSPAWSDDPLPIALGTATTDLRDDLDRVSALGSRAESLSPRQVEREQVLRTLTEAVAELARVEQTQATLDDRLASLPTSLAAAREELALAQHDAARVSEHQGRVVALTEAHEAGRKLTERIAQLAEVETLHADARAHLTDLKEAWLELREARITGIAAELAEALVAGADCPVCGSEEHPRPAARAVHMPTVESERQARTLVDDAEVALHGIDARQRDLLAEVAALRERVGAAGIDGTRAALSAAAQELATAREAEARAVEVARRVEQLQVALESAHREHAELAAARAGLEATVGANTDRRDEIDRELAEVLAGTPFDSVDGLVRASREVAAAGAAATEAAQALVAAQESLSVATSARDQCVVEQGFAVVADALGAALSADTRRTLQQLITDHDTALASARATLADPEVTAALAAPDPDLEALDEEVAECDRQWEELCDTAAAASRRATRLAALDEEFHALETDWAPLRHEHDVASGLAALVEGKSGDNAWRIRLSAYVLAWRLGQVVAAANERLVRMTDGRYLLEHSGHRSRRETRGGLSLLVRDEWSGDARDPATLSGGESFQVSLALALGLADVVSHEVGGSQLDTLFVDEGFGALDAESLDGVLDMLDALREGGRVVGVVSHVAEMRTRIPTQLVVAKDRSRGSTLQIARTDS